MVVDEERRRQTRNGIQIGTDGAEQVLSIG